MVCGAFKDRTASEPMARTSEAEKLFLKDLYTYMKKRGSPIERIPNLGFKQSNNTLYTCPKTFAIFFQNKSYHSFQGSVTVGAALVILRD